MTIFRETFHSITKGYELSKNPFSLIKPVFFTSFCSYENIICVIETGWSNDRLWEFFPSCEFKAKKTCKQTIEMMFVANKD